MFIQYLILPTESHGTLTKINRCLPKKLKQQNNPFNYRHVKHLYPTAQIDEPAIVICTAGFGHAGASLRLLAEWADNKANSVIVTSGYLPPDSPLKSAKENQYFKTADGETISVKADVSRLSSQGTQTNLNSSS